MFFISRACKPVCSRKIDDIKSTVQSSRVHTRRLHDAHMHVRNAHATFDYACMQIVSQGQRNINSINMSMYYGVTTLVIQDVNPAKEYLTVKLKR